MKATCAIDGCERPVKARGWCKAHYQHWHLYGEPGATTIRLRRRKPEACKIDGCDRTSRSFGWCPLHYTRWVKYGDPLHIALGYRSLQERLDAKTLKTDTCWIWTGTSSLCGDVRYGHISVQRFQRLI